MAKYQFSQSERYAVYSVHNEVCYMCRTPIDLQSMEVDHLLPESLGSSPERLKEVLEEFGLPGDFDLNAYPNWLPSCRPCNNRKSEKIFNATPRIQLELQAAADKAADAAALASKVVHRRKITRALNTLGRANENGELSNQDIEVLKPLVEFHIEQRTDEVDKPVKLTPLYTVVNKTEWEILVRGPYGVGARPVGEHVHSSYDCPNCGDIAAWNGARCVICGQMNDE